MDIIMAEFFASLELTEVLAVCQYMYAFVVDDVVMFFENEMR